MQQTSFPIEVLLGDDGSTDGTREICLRYGREHPGKVKVLLHEQEQRNPAHPPGRDNLITLLNSAEGRYIARCDGDDYWTDPTMLQKQVDLLETRPKVAGCFNWVQIVQEPGGELGRIYGDHQGKLVFQVQDTISELPICHPAGFVYRRSALLRLPEWLKEVPSADLAMFTLVADTGDLACIPQLMGIYRKHTGGITMAASHSGIRYHLNRVMLWLYVDRHLRYRYTTSCTPLIRFHWQRITWETTPRQRIRHLMVLAGKIPGWFLRKPAITIHFLRDAIRR